MNWCVAKEYKDANHKPVINIAGTLNRTVRSGETVTLEADITDKDSVRLSDLLPRYPFLTDQEKEVGAEELSRIVSEWSKFDILWWQYKEAGTYNGMVLIADPNASKTQFVAPTVKAPVTIHLILQATDRGSPALTDFARVIITVLPK
jgi:hypothetical protein